MRRSSRIALALTIAGGMHVLVPTVGMAGESTLSGSRASMKRQNEVAKQNDFSFVRNGWQVNQLVEDGRLVTLRGNADYALANVSYPYARPVLQTFVERLGAQYRDACSQKLVVTSLTRPVNEQPRNASPLSVHPAGMAVDLRIPNSISCRRWLEGTLLSLEQRGLLDVTREKNPPHYHVAVFPDAYATYAAAQIAAEEEARAAAAAAIQVVAAAPVVSADAPVARTGTNSARGPGIFVSVLLALGALIGGTLVMVRTHAAPEPTQATEA